MFDNTQYIAIIATSIIVTYGSYYIDSGNNEDQQDDINYIKYITTFIVVCCMSAGELYMYNNPDDGSTIDLVDSSISSEINKVSSKHDPSVIASLPDF